MSSIKSFATPQMVKNSNKKQSSSDEIFNYKEKSDITSQSCIIPFQNKCIDEIDAFFIAIKQFVMTIPDSLKFIEEQQQQEYRMSIQQKDCLIQVWDKDKVCAVSEGNAHRFCEIFSIIMRKYVEYPYIEQRLFISIVKMVKQIVNIPNHIECQPAMFLKIYKKYILPSDLQKGVQVKPPKKFLVPTKMWKASQNQKMSAINSLHRRLKSQTISIRNIKKKFYNPRSENRYVSRMIIMMGKIFFDKLFVPEKRVKLNEVLKKESSIQNMEEQIVVQSFKFQQPERRDVDHFISKPLNSTNSK